MPQHSGRWGRCAEKRYFTAWICAQNKSRDMEIWWLEAGGPSPKVEASFPHIPSQPCCLPQGDTGWGRAGRSQATSIPNFCCSVAPGWHQWPSAANTAPEGTKWCLASASSICVSSPAFITLFKSPAFPLPQTFLMSPGWDIHQESLLELRKEVEESKRNTICTKQWKRALPLCKKAQACIIWYILHILRERIYFSL